VHVKVKNKIAYDRFNKSNLLIILATVKGTDIHKHK